MADAFEVTYPCYLPMGEGESYLTIYSDGDHCLPLLTDTDNVECFFRDRFPKMPQIEVHTLTIPAREVLINVLEQFEAGRKAGKHDISYIAFDPVGNRIVPRTTVTEFIEYLTIEAAE